MSSSLMLRRSSPTRVLSIQSHVVRGYVGNRAAVFCLERLGHHVDVINSVQFVSTFIHEGQRMNGKDLEILFNGLLKVQLQRSFDSQRGKAGESKVEAEVEEKKLHPGTPVDDELLLKLCESVDVELEGTRELKEDEKLADGSLVGKLSFPSPQRSAAALVQSGRSVDYSHILTGYVGSASFLQEIVKFVRGLKSRRRKGRRDDLNGCHGAIVRGQLSEGDISVQWICDPVMGDNGKLYVPCELLEIYRDEVVPLADILTPNQFEVEWLMNRSVKSLLDVVKCCEYLHARGPHTVIVTSMQLEEDTDHLYLVASEEWRSRVDDEREGSANGELRNGEPEETTMSGWLIDSAIAVGAKENFQSTPSEEKRSLPGGEEIEKRMALLQKEMLNQKLDDVADGSAAFRSASSCTSAVSASSSTSSGSTSFSNASKRIICVKFPYRKVFLGGTGDLMSAMLLANLQKYKGDLKEACETSLATVQAIMEHTLSLPEEWHDVDVIGGQHLLEQPPLKYKAVELLL